MHSHKVVLWGSSSAIQYGSKEDRICYWTETGDIDKIAETFGPMIASAAMNWMRVGQAANRVLRSFA